MRWRVFIAVFCLLLAASARADVFKNLPGLDLPKLECENALWVENPIEKQFLSSKRVVVADMRGPGRIEMIHFAMPGALKLGREAVLRMYWDGEETPSVDCPLVDFFCDPAGQFERVNTMLLNKRRGFNAYFPMPFRKSARIEVVYDGGLVPGPELQSKMPCYSYVLWRKQRVSRSDGYFHANWRQQVVAIGPEDYVALEARGRGKFVGWSVTLRRPGSSGYLVDMNEMFFVDGEENPSIELQGIEDSFGFSWGFPESESEFPITGYRKYFQGAAAYRFFLNDAISFKKSLRVTINCSKLEPQPVIDIMGEDGWLGEFSSVCYWYQTEPHAPLPALPPIAERAPLPDDNPAWPNVEKLPSAAELEERKVRLHVRCGRPEKEVIHADEGFGVAAVEGFAFAGWPTEVYHCLAGGKALHLTLQVPTGATGTLRVFVIDPDRFAGGRAERLRIDGREFAVVQDFKAGKWIETPVTAADTADGRIAVAAENLKPDGNAVISILEWLSED